MTPGALSLRATPTGADVDWPPQVPKEPGYLGMPELAKECRGLIEKCQYLLGAACRRAIVSLIRMIEVTLWLSQLKHSPLFL